LLLAHLALEAVALALPPLALRLHRLLRALRFRLQRAPNAVLLHPDAPPLLLLLGA